MLAPDRYFGQGCNIVNRIEVAVVGAGVIGARDRACTCGSAGIAVAVLERRGSAPAPRAFSPAASAGSGARASTAGSRASRSLLAAAEERLDARVPFGSSPAATSSSPTREDVLDRLAANVQLQNEAGVPSRICRRRRRPSSSPASTPRALAGAAWCATDGYFDRPQAVVEAFADGVRVVLCRGGRGSSATARAGSLSLHDGERRRADASSSRPASRRPARSRRSGSSCRSRRSSASSSSPRRSASGCSSRWSSRRSAASPRSSSRTAGCSRATSARRGTRGGARARGGERRERGSGARCRPRVRRLRPRRRRGSTTPRPTRGDPRAGSGLDGLWLAAGFSGHGFMLAPAVGRIVAGAVLGERRPALAVLDAARFAADRLGPEPAARLKLLQLVVNGLVTGSVIAIGAVGVSLVFGPADRQLRPGRLPRLRRLHGLPLNVTWHLPHALGRVRDGRDRAARRADRARALAPDARRQAGLMSLFMTSIGLAFILRAGDLPRWGPQPRAYRDRTPTRSY